MSAYIYELPLIELSAEMKALLGSRLVSLLDHLDEVAALTSIQSRRRSTAERSAHTAVYDLATARNLRKQTVEAQSTEAEMGKLIAFAPVKNTTPGAAAPVKNSVIRFQSPNLPAA